MPVTTSMPAASRPRVSPPAPQNKSIAFTFITERRLVERPLRLFPCGMSFLLFFQRRSGWRASGRSGAFLHKAFIFLDRQDHNDAATVFFYADGLRARRVQKQTEGVFGVLRGHCFHGYT